MKPFSFFMLIASLSMPIFSHAQLTKGTKMANATAYMYASLGNDKSSNNSSKSNQEYLDLSTSLGYYMGKNWLVGGSVGTGFFYSDLANTGTGSVQTEQTRFNAFYNMGLFMRYYVKNTKKQGVFLLLKGDTYGVHDKINTTINGVKTDNDGSNRTDYSWNIGVGMHHKLNEEIAAEGTLRFGRSWGGDKHIELGIYPQMFVNKYKKKDSETPPQYIAKNRWLVNASLSMIYNITSEELNVGLGTTSGKMLTDKWMVGSHLNLSATTSAYKNLTAAPFVRYYIPLTHRFYIFPYLGAAFYYYGQKEDHDSGIRLDRGVGYNYFLTPSIALSGIIDGDIRHYNSVSSNSTFNSSSYKSKSAQLAINLGINYFLK
jgi:hypothetical protein